MGNAEAIKAEVYSIPFLGLVWNVPNDVSRSGALSNDPRIAIDSGDTPHLSWTDHMTGDYNTFTASGAIAIDGNGSLHVVWTEVTVSPDREVYYVRSGN